jgi:predicted NBD/HSP70 family sugar kinase
MITPRKPRHEHVISINPKVVRNINRALILNIIRERHPISRATIAQVTTLNKSTVSNIVAGLLQEDLIIEEADRSQSVGRNPINLRLKTGKHFIGTAYFDSGFTHLTIVDLDGTLKQTADVKTNAAEPKQFVIQCLDELAAMRKRAHLPHFKGIGVTVAGIVDGLHSRVVFAPNLGWEDVDMGRIIRDHSPDVPVVAVENDAKASALAELWFGKHEPPLFNFVFLSVGRGIGTGIVVDKRVLEGESHAAGEFGHTILIEGGEACSCGNRGCWEAYASDRATLQRYLNSGVPVQAAHADLTVNTLVDAAAAGDARAKQAIQETGRYLGLGIANIIKAVDPEAIVIGGSYRRVWDLVYPAIMEIVTARAFFGRPRNTAILPSSLRSSPPVLGAAALAIRKMFTDFRVAA